MLRTVHPSARDERGSTLIVVLVIMLVFATAGLALAVIVTKTAETLGDNRDTAESRAAADAGIADAVATARGPGGPCGLNLDGAEPKYTVESICSDTFVTFTSTGNGSSGAVTVTEAVYRIPWVDYAFDPAMWAGWDVPVWETCDFQNPEPGEDPVAAINALSNPTVVDLRSCGTVDMEDVELDIGTDVTLIVDGVIGRYLTVRSADGNDHVFHIIGPDSTSDTSPTCPDEATAAIHLRNVVLHEEISGLVYSPCTVTLGRRFGLPSRWYGQVYAGEIDWVGSPTGGILVDRPVAVPGLSLSPSLGGIVSQRDVR